jgi:hypothetical protein
MADVKRCPPLVVSESGTSSRTNRKEDTDAEVYRVGGSRVIVLAGRDGSEPDDGSAICRRDELATELQEADVEGVRIFGVEGPGWTAADAAGADGDRLMDSALLCARALGEDPAVLSVNAHLLGVGAQARAAMMERAPDERLGVSTCSPGSPRHNHMVYPLELRAHSSFKRRSAA